MADTRLKLQTELTQKETELKKLCLKKQKNEASITYSITDFFNLTNSDEIKIDEQIKKLNEEIADLEIQIENNTGILDTIRDTGEKATKVLRDIFIPKSVIKAQQQEEQERSRKIEDQIREKYHLHRKS